MNPALAALAVCVIGGGVVAVSARDARRSVVGLVVVLVVAPFIADPLPTPLAIALRIVGALLSGYLLWTVARDGREVVSSRVGWPAESLLAAAAAVAGLSSTTLTTPAITEAGIGGGTPAAQAAGFALVSLAIVPILEGRDALRLGTGSMLAVLAVTLLAQGLGVGIAPMGQLAMGALMIGVALTTRALAASAVTLPVRGEHLIRTGAHPMPVRPEGGPAVSGRRAWSGGVQGWRGSLEMGRLRVSTLRAGVPHLRTAVPDLRGGARRIGTRGGAGLSGGLRRFRRTELAGQTSMRARQRAGLVRRWLAVEWRGLAERLGRSEDAEIETVENEMVASNEDVAGGPSPSEEPPSGSAEAAPTPPSPLISPRSAGARRSRHRHDR